MRSVEVQTDAAASQNSSGRDPEVHSSETLTRSQPALVRSAPLKSLSLSDGYLDPAHLDDLLQLMHISSLIDAGGTFTVATNARLQKVSLITSTGSRINVTALIDGGASRNIIIAFYRGVAEELRLLWEGADLRSAGGYRLPTLSAWRGLVDAEGVVAMAHSEIVDLKGAAEMILGRSWLRDIGAIHDYGTDEIMVRHNGTTVRLVAAQEDRRVLARIEEPFRGAKDLQTGGVLTVDSGEQAIRVLPHPCEDLCTSAGNGEDLVVTCTGGTDEGYRVTNPSRVGPQSNAAIPSSTAPPSSCSSPVTLNHWDGTDNIFVEHGNDKACEDLQPADAPTALASDESSPLFGHNRCRTSTHWAFLAVDVMEDEVVPTVAS
ncbi:hypothetical protein C8R43DRAFT_1132975 [Mycena crocata]|nr:hypothetical protein C8R43DRAFT_1132975 [Mycena crocata]